MDPKTEGVSIEIREIHKRLGSNQALRGASCVLSSSTLHGLIGPDGAGKTTLMRILIGLLRPNQGEVIFKRAGVQVPFKDVRPHIAYMPQSQSLYSDLSVSEHLDFFRVLYDIPRAYYQERRRELLKATDMENFASRPAGKLSGGMYKKLGLMCALLPSPEILLLDEPTTGVDPISRREFWNLLYRLLAHSPILILASTSYMDEAERCGQVHLMENGKILASGEPRAVLSSEKVDNFEALFLKRAAAV